MPFQVQFLLEYGTMIVTALLLVAAVGLAFIAQQLRRAPEGYEDEHGFHMIRKATTGSKAFKLRRAHVSHHARTQPATAH